MIRVTIELLPQGNTKAVQPLATIEIANIGGGAERADYSVKARGTMTADATLRGHPRTHWRSLVLAAIRAIL